jgi:hypothetical protein
VSFYLNRRIPARSIPSGNTNDGQIELKHRCFLGGSNQNCNPLQTNFERCSALSCSGTENCTGMPRVSFCDDYCRDNGPGGVFIYPHFKALNLAPYPNRRLSLRTSCRPIRSLVETFPLLKKSLMESLSLLRPMWIWQYSPSYLRSTFIHLVCVA